MCNSTAYGACRHHRITHASKKWRAGTPKELHQVLKLFCYFMNNGTRLSRLLLWDVSEVHVFISINSMNVLESPITLREHVYRKNLTFVASQKGYQLFKPILKQTFVAMRFIKKTVVSEKYFEPFPSIGS